MTRDCTVMLVAALGALIFVVALTTHTLGGARRTESSSRIKSRVPASIPSKLNSTSVPMGADDADIGALRHGNN